MNALGLAILAAIVAVVLFTPKRWALMGAVAGILYLTQQQSIDVAGVSLYSARFVELAAFARVMLRKEFTFASFNRIDRAVVLLYCYTLGVFLIRSNEDYAYQIGQAVDAFLAYFAFRGLISSLDELRWFLKAFLLQLAPYAVLVVYETLTAQNPFAAIGGHELAVAGDLWFREGRLRATGSFGHPSLMGTLGGTFLAIYFGSWLSGKQRVFSAAGMLLCLTLIWASNSGGPATCAATTAVGWMLWPFRRSMQWVRRGTVLVIVGLALAMKAPIWYLLMKISNITGGDGWHRSALLDVAFQNLDQWWLAGMRTLDTSGWLPYTNSTTGAVDMTNHFLVFGITAGLGSVFLLIYMLVQGFKHLGRTLEATRARAQRDDEYLVWGIGVTLGVHLFNWFGISYWDQSNLLWLMHLALVGGLGATLPAKAEVESAAAPRLSGARAAPHKGRLASRAANAGNVGRSGSLNAP